jgi:chromosome segregation ATPase
VTTSPEHLAKARAADSERRRSRVLKALDQLAADGEEISVSAVARAAGVHRSLIHRHGDLHAAVLARAAEPSPGAMAGIQVSRQSLLADVANLTARNSRLSAHIARLERRLSQALGQAAWEASGLGAPADVETLTRRVTELEQKVLDLRAELAERDEDLAAARAANRELMTQVNR